MKLLLDAMYAPAVSEQLRLRGHDVLGAIEQRAMSLLRDPEIFALAQVQGRAVVTNNSGDFLRLERTHRQTDLPHYGLILTSDHRFNRNLPGVVGQLVLALDAFLRSQAEPAEPTSLVHWLQ